ncbi:MAG: galactose mutarotase [Acidobacteria bacterium]|nr:galactose mutarotase [Acidobacteriota bacterium]
MIILVAIMRSRLAVAIAATALVAACGRDTTMPESAAHVSATPFGQTPGGQAIQLFTFTNRHGVELRVMNYGAIIVSVKTPDRTGQLADVVLGHDTAAEYFTSRSFLGAVAGRYANRIAGGRFTLDGQTYTLAKNDGPNHLHGGIKGWDKVVWDADPFNDARGVGLRLSYTSADGEEGYPGRVAASVIYTLTDENALRVEYGATTDEPTVINLTQHSYFNLAGALKAAPILDHELTIDADRFTPVDAGLIPTGELRPVAGTPFDFRTPTRIGARIADNDEQLRLGRGYDHNFVLNRTGPGLSLAARVYEPTTGRTLEVLTTEPGLQFYSGNFLDGTVTGKGGVTYAQRTGFCLETQHFPNSPNAPAFPSAVLRPGDTYTSTTVFRFGVR